MNSFQFKIITKIKVNQNLVPHLFSSSISSAKTIGEQLLVSTSKMYIFASLPKRVLKLRKINTAYLTKSKVACWKLISFYLFMRIQCNQQYYQFSCSLELLQKLEPMREYLGIDYFEADAEADLHFLLGQQPQRKPSYCQLIPDGLFQDSANLLSHATCESPKHKPCNIPSEQSKEKKTKKRKENFKILPEGMQRGHWNLEENKRYHWFLQIYSTHFVNKHMRRMDKIFKTMERFVNTRQAEQCRSHHQKMEKKYGCFAKILKVLRNSHYGSTDAQLVLFDMKSNGVQCNEQLLSWDNVQSGVLQKSESVQVEKSPMIEVSEVSHVLPTFVDPLLQFECDGDQFLESLIS